MEVKAYKGKATMALVKVVTHFMTEGAKEHKPANIIKAVNLPHGSVYALLGKLYEHGWVDARWEDKPINEKGHPSRLYRLTSGGYDAGLALLQENLSPSATEWFSKPTELSVA